MPHDPTGHRPRPAIGYALILTMAALFIVNAGISRAAIRGGVDTQTLTTVRVTGSVPVLVAWAALVQPRALRPPRRALLGWIVLMGIVGVAGLQWTYFVAIDRLPIGIALLLEYTAPVLVALWVRFVLGEQVGPTLWPALGLSLAGLALVGQVWQGLALDGVGVVAGLGAAVCFATYFLVGDHTIGPGGPIHVMTWAFVIAAVALNLAWPLSGLDGDVVRGSVSLGGVLDHLSAPGWLLLLWIVVAGTVAPFALALFALRHLPATVVTAVSMTEPVGVTALAWVWFEEALNPVQMVGGAVLLAGIALAQVARPPHEGEPVALT